MGVLYGDLSYTIDFAVYLIDLILILVGYVFKAIAVYTMSKRAGYDKLWMSFIPFVNYILVGKIVGVSYIFRTKFNNVGVLACILCGVEFVLGLIVNCFYLGEISAFCAVLLGKKIVISGFLEVLYEWVNSYSVTSLMFSFLYRIVLLAKIVFTFFLIIALFRKYKPKYATLFAVLCIFFDFLIGIFLFVCRNDTPIDFQKVNGVRRVNVRVYPGRPDANNGFSGYNVNNADNQVELSDPFPEFEDEKPVSNNEKDDDPFSEFDKKDGDDLF